MISSHYLTLYGISRYGAIDEFPAHGRYNMPIDNCFKSHCHSWRNIEFWASARSMHSRLNIKIFLQTSLQQSLFIIKITLGIEMKRLTIPSHISVVHVPDCQRNRRMKNLTDIYRYDFSPTTIEQTPVVIEIRQRMRCESPVAICISRSFVIIVNPCGTRRHTRCQFLIFPLNIFALLFAVINFETNIAGHWAPDVRPQGVFL